MTNTARRNIESIHLPILHEIEHLMETFPHTRSIRDYGYKRTFENGMRCDLLCHQAARPAVFRIGRGAWLVRTYPLLDGLFDETGRVVGKIFLSSAKSIEHKGISALLQLIADAPTGIGDFD